MRLLLPCIWAIATVAWSGIEYVHGRQAAAELARAGKTAEAHAAFLALANGDASENQRADALEEAARLANRLGRTEEAVALARRISLPHAAMATEMQILADHRQWREIVARFANEDLALWPDMRVGTAAFCRGQAFRALGDSEAAARDFRLATEHLLEDNALGLAFIALGDAYRQRPGNDDRALAAYRQAYRRRNAYKRTQAAMNAAAILRGRGDAKAALAELDVIPMEQVVLPDWRARLLAARGETLASAGRREEARASYAEALALDGVAEGIRKTCEQAMRQLAERPQ